MKTQQEKKSRQLDPTMRAIRFGITICTFLVLVFTLALFSVLEFVISKYGITDADEGIWRFLTILICALVSIPVGSLITYFLIKVPINPIRKLLYGMQRLAQGHFDERLDYGRFSPLREVESTFNLLASELENTEMLRSDFVNNFSHEFKTPIVSINGFARLLQRGQLTEEEKQEYVNIIADESTRLAGMAVNVLNLTQVENQSILTNVKQYNLSEQLRKCILLLEKKWSGKNLEMQADFQEYSITADQDLLGQVWVNLLDNAVKFAPEGSPVSVTITPDHGWILVSVINHGPEIKKENLPRLFDKFWQEDSSHASEGIGVGLSVVKKIVKLHRGRLEVQSDKEKTVFSVFLPVVQ